MCGIVGVAGRAPVQDARWLTSAVNALAHRGPDDRAEWCSTDQTVALGHRRLSIIDLSAAGRQPMHSLDGNATIVFNGEIYNYRELRAELCSRGHRFASRTDTEVILAAYQQWGTECLPQLNGMFAFAIYDATRGMLFLARDRAGEKPLYYRLTDTSILFGSELKALFADPTLERRVDRSALDCYLGFGFVPGSRSIVANVHKLPPAHALTYQIPTGRSQVWRYWSLPPLEDASNDEALLLEELESLLQDAIARQLVADVPVGVLLSGGVDSSLTAALAVRVRPDVRTFTVRFPGYGRFDETEHARLVARALHTDHTELEAGDPPVALVPLLARQFDEPIVDSSMIPTYLVSKLIREHCKVALGGDGGDELFGGYAHYNRLLWLAENVTSIPLLARRVVANVAMPLMPIGMRGRASVKALATDFQTELPYIATMFDRQTRSTLMARYPPWASVAEEVAGDRIPRSRDPLQRQTRMDFENYLPEDILVKVDRASMLTSLEVRAPLLDYRVVEFAFGRVPSRLKTTATARKILLKQLAAKVLPPSFDLKRKQGFSVPLGTWLTSGAWRDFFQDVLAATPTSTFDKKVVADLFRGQVKGRNNSERLFALAMFELWRQEYAVTI